MMHFKCYFSVLRGILMNRCLIKCHLKKKEKKKKLRRKKISIIVNLLKVFLKLFKIRHFQNYAVIILL